MPNSHGVLGSKRENVIKMPSTCLVQVWGASGVSLLTQWPAVKEQEGGCWEGQWRRAHKVEGSIWGGTQRSGGWGLFMPDKIHPCVSIHQNSESCKSVKGPSAWSLWALPDLNKKAGPLQDRSARPYFSRPPDLWVNKCVQQIQ